ncbi:MAG TPA: hypothetical protein VKS24_04840 [Bradyrhizobium sp.]|nr:hypothetical protein [Bradyrhizobium sp.]
MKLRLLIPVVVPGFMWLDFILSDFFTWLVVVLVSFAPGCTAKAMVLAPNSEAITSAGMAILDRMGIS